VCQIRGTVSPVDLPNPILADDARDHLRLSNALANRYRIERELGQRGMVTVYLVEGLKQNRNVALMVLRPELAAVFGADRGIKAENLKRGPGASHGSMSRRLSATKEVKAEACSRLNSLSGSNRSARRS
jgi:hypothetical protein